MLGWMKKHWIVSAFAATGAYVATKMVQSRTQGTLNGQEYTLTFSLYPPRAFGNGRARPGPVYTVEVPDSLGGIDGPLTIGSWTTEAQAMQAVAAYQQSGLPGSSAVAGKIT